MTSLVRFLVLSLGLTHVLHAADIRVLEITSDARKLAATVEFLTATTNGQSVQTLTTASKSFDWLDIPTNAKAARIKVGELSTLPFELKDSGTTLVELGAPTVSATEGSLPVAVLARTVKTDRDPAPADATGWIYFGGLHTTAPATPGQPAWSSLYLVLPPKVPLDLNNAGTKDLVEGLAKDKLLRVDFPLILRSADTQGKIQRSKEDVVIRAGQYVLVKSFRDPDEHGNVYAEVKVMTPPSDR